METIRPNVTVGVVATTSQGMMVMRRKQFEMLDVDARLDAADMVDMKAGPDWSMRGLPDDTMLVEIDATFA